MRIRFFMLLALLVVVTGCGKKPVPVSGRVTLDSKPLVNATVIFTPDTDEKNPGAGSVGKTNANGEFKLRVNPGDLDGAFVGKHKVSITSYEGDDGTVPSSGPDMIFRKAIVPSEYNADSKLSFDVPEAGSTSANFDLKSNPATK